LQYWIDGSLHIKKTGEPFACIFEDADEGTYVAYGTATVLTSSVNKKVYAVTRLPGSKMCKWEVKEGKDQLQWIPPGTYINEVSHDAYGHRYADALQWTGTSLKPVILKTSAEGDILRDDKGIPLVENKVVVSMAMGVKSDGTISYAMHRIPSQAECQKGLVQQQLPGNDKYSEIFANYPIDTNGQLLRNKLVEYYGNILQENNKIKWESFFVINSLMADCLYLHEGSKVDVAVEIDGEKCREVYTYNGKAITRQIIRSSGKTASFPVNRDADGNLHWAKTGGNIAYCRVNELWYEKVYSLDNTGKTIGTAQYYAVQWREDGSIYRGAKTMLADRQGVVVPDY